MSIEGNLAAGFESVEPPIAAIHYADSSTSAAGITRGDVAALVVRVLGIYIMLGGLSVLGYIISYGFRFSRTSITYLLILAVEEGLGISAVAAAPWIGRKLLPKKPIDLGLGATPGSPAELQAAAFAVVGTWLAATSLPTIFYALIAPVPLRPTPGPLFESLIRPVTELVVGVLLFVGSKRLARFWSRLRYGSTTQSVDRPGPL